MKSRLRFVVTRAMLALTASGLLQSNSVLAQNTWTAGGGAITNWSNINNWSSFLDPQSYDTVLFGNTPPPPGVANGVVDNALDKSYLITAFQYSTASTNGGGYHTTLIPPGLSLDIFGSGGNAIFVGTGVAQNNESIYSRFVGGGTLTVTNTTGAIQVAQVGAAADHYATLDLSGLTNFSANVDQLLVGAFTFTTGLIRPMGIMRLAETNFLQTSVGITKPGIMVAAFPGSDVNVRGTQQLFFGRQNTINSDVISVGGHKSTGQILFRSGLTGGFATLRGSLGGTDRVKLLTIGDPRARIADLTGGGTSTASTGTFDTTGNFLDLAVVDLMVSRSQTTGTGNSTGTLTYDQGTIDVNNLYIGYHTPGTTTAANATGTVNVNGTATLTINNDLVMANKVGTGTPVATLNVASNATVNVKSNVVTSGGTSTLNLNGTLNLQPSGDPSPGTVTVGTLTGFGTIQNAASITNTTALTPGTSTAPGTVNLANNLTLASGAVLNLNLTNAGVAAANDLVNVTGDLNLNNNLVVVTPLGDSFSGSYRLFNYTGTRNGSLNLTNSTRYLASISYPASQVNLDVTGGGPATVRWNSLSSALWDLTTSNWLNTGSSAVDRFFQLDRALVDDSGTFTNLLLLSTVLYPSNVTVNSSTRDYSFGGSGRISGVGSVVKQGTSMLTVSNANDFSGPVTVSAGTLRLGNASALGNTNSGTTVASGATLDIYGQSIYNPGDLISIAGTGLNSTGAVINTGAAQNNAIRYLALSDNSTVRNDNRWDVRGPGGNSTFSGGLYLNGFTLTKLGGAQMSVVDSIATNAGSILVGGGTFSMTRSQIDGPGYIEGLTNVVLFENSSTGYLAKPISFAGTTNGTLRVTGNAVVLGVPITNAAGLIIDVSANLMLSNTIYGAGGITKSSGSQLILAAPQACTGPTLISAGRITFTNNGAIATTPSIAMVSGSSMDATALPAGFTLDGSQMLSGIGTLLGDFSANANANIVVGGNIAGTLIFSNNVALNGSTNTFNLGADPTQIGGGVNSLMAVSNNLTLTGVNTLFIKPLAALSTAVPYTVITYSNSLSGGLANLQAASSNPRYNFSVVDPSTTPGAIQVSVSGIPTTLMWKGGAAGNPNAWDSLTLNWLNGAAPDLFFAGDSVNFDDSATTGTVNLAGTQQPAGVTVNNNSLAYTIGGTGSLLAGTLDKSGSASLRVTNDSANSFAGSVAIAGGAVTLGNAGANAITGTLTVSGGGLTFANSGANTFNGAVLTTAGSLTLANGGLNTLASGFTNNGAAVTLANTLGNTFSRGATVNAGSFTILNPGANTLSQPFILNGGTLTFDQTNDATFAAVLMDEGVTWGGVEKKNNFTLTVSGNNTNFDGPILISGGTLKSGNGFALGNTNGTTTVLAGATLDVNGQSMYNPGEIVVISGDGVGGAGAIGNTGAAQQNCLRAVVLANNASVSAWTNRWDIRGPAAGAGSLNLNGYRLNKLGPGQISVVDADLSNNGSINIYGGLISFTRDTVLGDGVVNVSTNIIQFENYTSGYFYKPLITGGGVVRLVGNTFALDGAITNTGGAFVDVANAVTLTLNNTVTGAGWINKTNTGTLVYAQTNDYAGGTTIAAGALQLGSGTTGGYFGDIPPAPGGIITNNGTIIFNRADDVAINDQITGSGALQQNTGGRVFLTASNSYSGQTTLNTTTANSPAGSALRISNSSGLGTTNGITSINGNTTGNSTLELVGNITVPEPFSLSARQAATTDTPHILNVSDNNAITGPIIGNTGGGQYNIKSDSGKLTMAGAFIPPITVGTRVLKLMGDGNGEWSGIISNSTDGVVPALVTKTGAGTWTLSGSNVYRGATTITAGKLAIAATGSINSTPSIDVQSGATFDVSAAPGFTLASGQLLRGDGTVLGSLIVGSSATLSVGANAIGTMFMSNALAFVAGGTNIVEVDLDNGTNDFVAGLTTVTYGGTLNVVNVSATTTTLTNGSSFKLFNAASYSGAFASILPVEPAPGLAWDTSQLTVNGTLRVGLPGAPNPTGIGLLGDGNIRLTISGAVGQPYTVKASTNAALPVVTWQVLSSGTVTTSPFFYEDLTATNYPQRFYLISSP